VAASVTLAGCGGSVSPTAATQADQASVRTVMLKSVTPPSPAAIQNRSKHDTRSTKGSVLVRRADTVHTGRVVQSGAETPAASGDDTSPPGQHTGPNPCALVSKATAQAVVGARIVSRTEAPLGPTCIFKTARGGQITIAVEQMSFSAVARELGKRKSVKVAGRPAYCGTRGMQTLFVSLNNGGVLNVTAPCAVARRIAAKALPRLHD
jgi:hypothetical protein